MDSLSITIHFLLLLLRLSPLCLVIRWWSGKLLHEYFPTTSLLVSVSGVKWTNGHQRKNCWKPRRNLHRKRRRIFNKLFLVNHGIYRHWPGVHPTVDDRVVHGVAHGEPVDAQVQLLDVRLLRQLRNVRHYDEVGVEWQPADGEDEHHDHHHFNDLRGSWHVSKSVVNITQNVESTPLAFLRFILSSSGHNSSS